MDHVFEREHVIFLNYQVISIRPKWSHRRSDRHQTTAVIALTVKVDRKSRFVGINKCLLHEHVVICTDIGKRCVNVAGGFHCFDAGSQRLASRSADLDFLAHNLTSIDSSIKGVLNTLRGDSFTLPENISIAFVIRREIVEISNTCVKRQEITTLDHVVIVIKPPQL